jgi:hypothetical protein
MKALRGILAALLAAAFAAPGAIAAEARAETLHSFSTPGYTIFAHDEAAAHAVATNLATVEQILGAMFKRELRAPAQTNVILLSLAEWKHYLRSGLALPEEWVLANGTTYLILRSDVSRKRLQRGAFHQGAHLFLRRHFDGEFPLWFEEGLALVMQNTLVEGRQAIVGRGNYSFGQLAPDRQERKPRYENLPWVTRERWISLDELLRMRADSPEYRSSWAAGSVNQESRALVHLGLIGEPKLGAQMIAYVDALHAGKPVDEAVQASFGMKVVDLERILTRYTSRADFPVTRVTFEPPAEAVVEAGRTVSTSESVAMFAALEAGATPP